MKILIIGSQSQAEELQEKFGSNHEYTVVNDANYAVDIINNQEVVFDFMLDESPDNLEVYMELEGLLVFVNAPKISLAETTYLYGKVDCTLIGFNGLPSFVNRELLEVSLLKDEDETILKRVCGQLSTQYEIVKDRIGMVTPRIICMIINEAYYTVQEGTASKEDIDKGMKLGTNYPFGPFEWSEMIGIDNVYELLEAVYEDTKDERYKICPMLKREYLINS